MKTIPCLLVGFAIVVPLVSAQTPSDHLLVRDARGDTGFLGVPLPVGLDAYDLVEITAGPENETTLELRLKVAAVSSAPALGEIGAHMRINGSYWVVGWTTIAFPVPPFVYRGGFYCPSDAARAVDASKCDSLEAQVHSDAYVIKLERRALSATQAGIVLEHARGYADLYNSDGTAVRLDETMPGVAYHFTTGNNSKLAGAARPATQRDAATPVPTDISAGAPERTGGEAAGLPMLAPLLLLAAIAAWRRAR